MEFTLDLSKWICGREQLPKEGSRLGVGESKLLNDQGYQCCVGQFAEQCGVPRDRLRDRGTLLVFTTFKALRQLETPVGDGRPLDYELYDVNDDCNKELDANGRSTIFKIRTIPEKIEEIRRLLAQAGHTLKVLHEELIPQEVTSG